MIGEQTNKKPLDTHLDYCCTRAILWPPGSRGRAASGSCSRSTCGPATGSGGTGTTWGCTPRKLVRGGRKKKEIVVSNYIWLKKRLWKKFMFNFFNFFVKSCKKNAIFTGIQNFTCEKNDLDKMTYTNFC